MTVGSTGRLTLATLVAATTLLIGSLGVLWRAAGPDEPAQRVELATTPQGLVVRGDVPDDESRHLLLTELAPLVDATVLVSELHVHADADPITGLAKRLADGHPEG